MRTSWRCRTRLTIRPVQIHLLASSRKLLAKHLTPPKSTSVSPWQLTFQRERAISSTTLIRTTPRSRPRAIVKYILHYTKPGDLVLDGFCGSGMTGVAAQLRAAPPTDLKTEIEDEYRLKGISLPTWGVRPCVLSDLSPVATFIAYNYNVPLDTSSFEKAAGLFFATIGTELSWLYQTTHTSGSPCRINYTVWSEIFICPDCSKEINYVNEALDRSTKRVRDEFPCPHCGATVTKRSLQKKKEQFLDPYTNETHLRNSQDSFDHQLLCGEGKVREATRS